MLYIHKLTDLNQRIADQESVYLIREIKQKFNLPLSFEQLNEYFKVYDLPELTEIEKALTLFEPTLNRLKQLIMHNHSSLELINLERSLNILASLGGPLQKNYNYCLKLTESLKQKREEFTRLLNLIPTLKTKEEKVVVNNKISDIFETILRNKEFWFNGSDIINEGPLNNIVGLHEGVAKGFLYHFTLEEELKKVNVSQVKAKVSPEVVAEVREIEENIVQIKRAAETAYQINKKMVDFSVILYSLVKWANSR